MRARTLPPVAAGLLAALLAACEFDPLAADRDGEVRVLAFAHRTGGGEAPDAAGTIRMEGRLAVRGEAGATVASVDFSDDLVLGAGGRLSTAVRVPPGRVEDARLELHRVEGINISGLRDPSGFPITGRIPVEIATGDPVVLTVQVGRLLAGHEQLTVEVDLGARDWLPYAEGAAQTVPRDRFVAAVGARLQ